MAEAIENKGFLYEFGQYVLDTEERALLANGRPVHLPDKVFDTLLFLLQNSGRILTKDEMMKALWSESFVEESNLAKNISRLRKTLNTEDSQLIETLPRRGYRFLGDVRQIEGDTSLVVRRNLRVKITHSVDDEPVGAIGGEATTGQAEHRLIGSRPSYVPVAMLATVLLAITSGLGFYFLKGDASQLQNEGSVIRLTDDPANDFWPKWTHDGRIRFFRMSDDKHGKNMLMNADGTGQTEVGPKDSSHYLHYSPDGLKVIFTKPGDNTARYLANVDGSDEIALPLLGNTDWSADSKRFVYQVSVGEGEGRNSELFIYSLETGKTENITNHPGFDADPNFSPDGGQVIFTTTRDGNAEIYLMNSDGSNVRRLTDHQAHENHPVFSPDGTTIAFNSDRDDENQDVYLMNTDGGDIRNLTDWKSNETVEPGCWSRDGTQIAFYSDHEGNDDIYITSAEVFKPQLVLADEENDLQYPSTSADGKQVVFQALLPDKSGEVRVFDTESGQTRVLTKTETGDIQPVISPDGSHVVFQNKIGSNTEICLINIDGTGLTNVTQHPSRDMCPSFSPDGKRIAFATNRDGSTALFHLYTMNVDGSDQRRVYLKEGLVFGSSWSPDGREITFVNDGLFGGNFELFSVALDDPLTGKQLTHRPRSDGYPSVSPDGTKVAFASNADGNWEIYVMNQDGTGQLRLTRDLAEDLTPQFSRDGSKIFFSGKRGGKAALYQIDLTQ